MTATSVDQTLHFGTIITRSHLAYARTVLASLARHSNLRCVLHCLVVDAASDVVRAASSSSSRAGLQTYCLADLSSQQHSHGIIAKYAGSSADALRWSLKPVFIATLLKELRAPVAFVDPDQYFVNDPAPLFRFGEGATFRLSPHWRPIAPTAGTPFLTQFTSGLYNGGLFVARSGAEPLLDWWAAACLWRCERRPSEGLYVDQKYLDVVPIFFEGVEILRHKGFNVASWNRLQLTRRATGDGVSVEGDPLVSVHFSGSTIRDIRAGLDPCLEPVLRSYEAELAGEGARLPAEPSPRRSTDGLGSLATRVVGPRRADGLRRLARRVRRSLAELQGRPEG